MGSCPYCLALRPDLHAENCPHKLGITNEDDPTMIKDIPPQEQNTVHLEIEVQHMKVGDVVIWYCVLPMHGADNGFDSVTLGRTTPQELKLAAQQYLYGVDGVA